MDASSPTPAPQPATNPPERLGLALSGGGFRASFFHLGVLARLADLGVLRHVDILSTVSGGTIVGAYYYLYLKKLLEKTAAPTDDEYRQLVRDVQVDFLRAVRKNIRGRILLNPYKNYRMLGRKYSRGDRIGDLYDRYLYKKAWGEPGRRFLRDLQIQLRWLVFTPKAWQREKGQFNPWYHNETLPAKVPILVMNATSLNTGHNWRFEAVRMGEPSSEDQLDAKLLAVIDVNERLEQAYFKLPDVEQREPAVPPSQQAFPLAKAVAASSCVPLLFHPLSVSDMYLHRRVQLVDGGVHDNQGVQALFDSQCTAVIASDASGLMGDTRKPPPFAFAVAPRAMSIYGTRIRIEQLVRVCEQRPTALMHLLSDIPAPTVAPLPKAREVDEDRRLTVYGINRAVQKCLARVRTDLDSFTDIEAFTLMYSGYRMSAYELDEWLKKYPEVKPFVDNPSAPIDPGSWCFAPVADPATKEHPPAKYMRLLGASHSLFFKSLLSLPRWAGFATSALLVVGIAAAVFGISWGAVHDAFDLGSWSNWWWLGMIALIPALLSIFALLQLLGGWLYLRMGGATDIAQ